MFALVDAENFYVSCERVFDPALRHQPVIVLSNNDGCAVSRSAEAKALGIRMGAPYWQLTAAQRRAVRVLSGNPAPSVCPPPRIPPASRPSPWAMSGAWDGVSGTG